MAQANRSGGLWEDISASYRRTVGELHAVAYPGFPSIRDFGRSPPSQEATAPVVANDSVLEDRLPSVEASREDPGRDEPEIDRD